MWKNKQSLVIENNTPKNQTELNRIEAICVVVVLTFRLTFFTLFCFLCYLIYFFTPDLFQVRMCLPCVQVGTPPIVPASTWHPEQLSRTMYETETRSLDRPEFSLNQPLKCPHRYFSSLHSFFIYILLKKLLAGLRIKCFRKCSSYPVLSHPEPVFL